MKPVTTWRYYLPSIDGEGWAEIVVCSSGFFAAVSDYGNYAFAWRSFGDGDFREWLAHLERDPGYVMCKLHHGQLQYDGNETVRAIKTHILAHRRSEYQGREWARDEWDLLEQNNGLCDEADLVRWYDDTKIDDAGEYVVRKYPADLRAFCERTLPRLAKVMREEIAAEKQAA